jgi:hypothetical protein
LPEKSIQFGVEFAWQQQKVSLLLWQQGMKPMMQTTTLRHVQME